MTSFRIPLAAVLCAVLSLCAFALATAFAPLPTALAVLALPSLALRGTVAIPRSLVLPSTLVLALVIFTNLGELRQASPMAAVPAAYPAGLLLGALLLAYLYRRNDEKEGLTVLALAALVLMDAGVTTEPFPFFLLAGAAVVAMALGLRSWMPGIPRGVSPPWDRTTAAAALLLVPACVLALVVAFTLRWSEASVNQVLRMAEPSLGGGVTFQANTALGTVWGMRSDRVLARLHSDGPPDYLLARVYFTCKDNGSRWDGGSYDPVAAVDRATLASAAVPAAGTVFPLQPLSTEQLALMRPAHVDMVDLTGKCGNVFIPRDGLLVGGALQQMARDAGGSCLPLPVEQGLPAGRYWLARGKAPVTRESASMLETCLQLPPAVREYAQPLAEHLVRGASSPEQKANALRDWFHVHFKYDLAVQKRDPDKLKQFLLEKTPAHCEFFAAGLTVLLRSLGVPARYVTGFMVYEKNRLGGYYVIRDQHAHAWVEVYFEGRGWVTYDPTPPGAAQSPPASEVAQWMEYLLSRVAEWKAGLTSFSWRSIGRALLDGAQGLGRWLIERPWRVVLLLAIFAVEALFRRADAPGRRWLRRIRRRQVVGEVPPEEARMRAVLEQFEAWASGWGPPRPPHRTLLEWARSWPEPMQDEAAPLSPESREGAVEFLRVFSFVRYASSHPAPEQLQDLEERVARLQVEQPPSGRRQDRRWT